MTPRIVMAGGGTAGHVNPLLATAHVLRERGCEVSVLGTAEGLEATLVPDAGLPFSVIPRVPFPRRPNTALLTFPARFHEATRKAEQEIRGADVVVGFGGYVSTPAYRAAKKLGVPIVVHEQNARPGLANKVGAANAKVVALTFASTPLSAKNGTTIVTGLPLRPVMADLAQKRLTPEGADAARVAAAERLGLRPDLATIVITGGSLGAQHVNEVMVGEAPSLPHDVQVLHLTGKGKDAAVREALRGTGVEDRWVVLDYLTTMEDALAVADLVVCRSGAGTVAELTALGIPAVYVPLPIGNGEQRLNAADHVAAGGALMVADAQLDDAYVRTTIFPLITSGEYRQMREATAGLGIVDAAQRLAEAIIEEVQG